MHFQIFFWSDKKIHAILKCYLVKNIKIFLVFYTNVYDLTINIGRKVSKKFGFCALM